MGLILKLAWRTMARRRGRMALIGTLVAFGTFLVVFGTAVADSAREASRNAIRRNFTGDFILYSERSRELPSPFAFNTPLPPIRNLAAVEAALEELPELEAYAPYSQNYGIIQVEREGERYDLPFIFYAIEPESYARVFSNVEILEGDFLSGGSGGGVAISAFQNSQYADNYGLSLRPGEPLTLLGVTEGGVNSLRSRLRGIFEPRSYASVFNYINFMDAESYAALYSYAGVAALPADLDAGLAAAWGDEDAIFGLAESGFGELDLGSLEPEPLSGATMIAVRLREGSDLEAAMAALEGREGLGIRAASWEEASGFYARIASSLQAFIYLATALVFLVVGLIFANTLIINVIERTAEIGTMRALGGERSFVRSLFLAEALILNLSSALAAMAAAGAAIAALGRRGLPLPETVSQFLIGGGSLALRAEPLAFVQALGAVALVSVLATLYPVRVAASITPLRAMGER